MCLMAYVIPNFKTKTILKRALEAGERIEIFDPGIGSGRDYSIFSGTVCVEGPHCPQPHKWYAELTLENGKIVRVK